MVLRIFLCLNFLYSAIIACGQTSSCQINITHKMGEGMLKRDTNYVNPAGEEFSVSRFRYFLSNFALLTADDQYIPLPVNYYLVDDSKPESKTISIRGIPAGTYKGIRFLLGVDSTHNVSGPQSGALAVESGMFWTWNSGYIMAQLEGHSPVIKSPTREFVFHVGGYKEKDQVLKYITLTFPEKTGLSDKHISMVADVNKWFLPDTIRFTQQPVIMAPNAQARRVAANYQHMFQITAIR